MEEFKYMAWNKENSKLYEVAKIDIWGDPDQGICDLAREDDEIFEICINEVYLLKNTGAVTADGFQREIYDGHVLSFEGMTCDGETVFNRTLVVFWNKKNLNWSVLSIEGDFSEIEPLSEYLTYPSGKASITGMVFEDKDLLEKYFELNEFQLTI